MIDRDEVIKKYLLGRENELINFYLENGGDALKTNYDIDDEHFVFVFDYLVFNHNLLFKVVFRNSDFFTDLYVRKGATSIRRVLNVLDEKYDAIFSIVFDYLAIAGEALCDHVRYHVEVYVDVFNKHGAVFLRNVLGLFDSKYGDVFKNVLDVLLNESQDFIVDEKTLDLAIGSFSNVYNDLREYRKIGEK